MQAQTCGHWSAPGFMCIAGAHAHYSQGRMAPPPGTWAARLCHVAATGHLCQVTWTHEFFSANENNAWLLQAEAIFMPSAVVAFGGIRFQSDQTGNQSPGRIQGGAPQVAIGKRNPLSVV